MQWSPLGLESLGRVWVRRHPSNGRSRDPRATGVPNRRGATHATSRSLKPTIGVSTTEGSQRLACERHSPTSSARHHAPGVFLLAEAARGDRDRRPTARILPRRAWRTSGLNDSGSRRSPSTSRRSWRRTTPNGSSAPKLFWFQFQYLLTKLGRTFGRNGWDPSLLNEVFPNLRFVLLTRRDKVRQAISYVRAIQSDVWWSIPGDPEARPTPKAEPIFDREEIERRVAHLIYLEATGGVTSSSGVSGR